MKRCLVTDQFFLLSLVKYSIHPNYHTVHLSFSKLLGKTIVNFCPNKGISAENFLRCVFNDSYVVYVF